MGDMIPFKLVRTCICIHVTACVYLLYNDDNLYFPSNTLSVFWSNNFAVSVKSIQLHPVQKGKTYSMLMNSDILMFMTVPVIIITSVLFCQNKLQTFKTLKEVFSVQPALLPYHTWKFNFSSGEIWTCWIKHTLCRCYVKKIWRTNAAHLRH